MKILLFVSATALFLLLSFIPQTEGGLKYEKQALLNFAAAFPHSRRKLNWFSSNSICSSWVGITCDRNGTNVLAIRLPGIGLSGPIPTDTIGKLGTLVTLSLRSNRLSGELPSDILSLPSLHYLYLQNNNLSGSIPSSSSPQISVLDLSYNSFTGSLPSTLQNLQNLTSLSLQNNYLTGPIPALNATTLKQLNLSFNHLNGSVPSSLQKFPAFSFEGNSELCGPPLSQCPELSPAPSPSPYRGFFPSAPSPTPALPSPTPSAIPSPNWSPVASQEPRGGSGKGLSKGSIVAVAAGGSAVLLLGVAVVVVCCLKKSDGGGNSAMLKAKGARSEAPKEDFGSGVQEAEKNKLVFFEGASHNFDLEDLLRASAEVLGKGSYGTTYKAILEDGTAVAVKRLKEVIVGKKEFELQMEAVGRVGHHQNVVPLRAYYYSKDEKLLVYDYIPAGSFSSQLHGNKESGQTPLDWESRLKASLGAARGIGHIHSAAGGKLVHGNIKSSNVLLTPHLDGRVSDFGLASLMSHPNAPSRTTGYRAPEVIETRKLTQKSDVYSFGVVLLEMLTGKSPVQVPGQDEAIDLPRWVQSVVREEWTAEVFDVQLVQYQNIEDEMVQMLQVAMACVARTPESRPTMAEVVQMIDGIRPTAPEHRPSSEENKVSLSPSS